MRPKSKKKSFEESRGIHKATLLKENKKVTGDEIFRKNRKEYLKLKVKSMNKAESLLKERFRKQIKCMNEIEEIYLNKD